MKPHSKNMILISHRNPNSDPLCYPLLFPYGTSGHIEGFRHTRPSQKGIKISNVSYRKFYCHRFMFRSFSTNDLFRMGKLFQQNIVDAYTRIENT